MGYLGTKPSVATSLPDNIVTADKIVSGAVTDAKIAAMAASKLTGVLPDANAPSGSVIQVVQTVKGDTYSQNTNTFLTIPGLSVSITPRNSTNIILVTVEVSFSGIQNAYIAFKLQRNGTDILVPTETGTGIECSGGSNINSSGNKQFSTHKEVFSRLDSPNTTSPVTYSVQISPMRTSAMFACINRSEQLGDDNQFRTVSTITAMEIAA